MKKWFDPRKAISMPGKRFREGITTIVNVPTDYRGYATKSVPMEEKLVGIDAVEWEAIKSKVEPAWKELVRQTDDMASRPERTTYVPSVKPEVKPAPHVGPVGVWSINDALILKGIVLDNARINPVTGKSSNYMPFKIPLITVVIGRSHWNGSTIIIKRNTRGNIKVESPVPGLHGSITRSRLKTFFGNAFGSRVADILEMPIEGV